MRPYDPQEVEMFSALAWIDEQERKFEDAGLEALRAETELAAW